MTGPYTARLYLAPDRGYTRDPEAADMVLRWERGEGYEELMEGSSIAGRYWQRGGGATVDGTLQSATLFAAALLAPGEEVAVEIFGREVQQSGDKQVVCRTAYARRDEHGRAYTTLGNSRWGNERHFRGL